MKKIFKKCLSYITKYLRCPKFMKNEKSDIMKKNGCIYDVDIIENNISSSFNQNSILTGQIIKANTKIFSLKKLFSKN